MTFSPEYTLKLIFSLHFITFTLKYALKIKENIITLIYMKKMVYLDTTIPSYYFDNRESLKYPIELTKLWWERESKNYSIWLSEETIAELSEGNYPKKDEIFNFISKIPILKPDEKIIDIAQIYLDNYVMPQVLKGDAIHLAYASYYKIDFLLTWNCNHLANANKKEHIRILNTRLNIGIPDLITPLNLFKEEVDDIDK